MRPSPGLTPGHCVFTSLRQALVAAGLCIAHAAPASAACVVLAGTADGFDKETAVSRAQLSLDDYIKQYKTENHLGAVTVKAMRADRSLIGAAE